MTVAWRRPRSRAIALVAIVGVLGLAAEQLAVRYLSRDRGGRSAASYAGTKYQFVTAVFYIFNETGRSATVRASAGGRVLFERQLPAEYVRPDGRHTPHEYTGRYPYVRLWVDNFDSLTRWLELTDLPGGRTEQIDLESLPKDEAGDFSIRITPSGYVVRRAKYVFI